jgi:hypothetical protein
LPWQPPERPNNVRFTAEHRRTQRIFSGFLCELGGLCDEVFFP